MNAQCGRLHAGGTSASRAYSYQLGNYEYKAVPLQPVGLRGLESAHRRNEQRACVKVLPLYRYRSDAASLATFNVTPVTFSEIVTRYRSRD